MAGILSHPISYRDLVLNEHFSAAGEYVKANEKNTYVVENFDFSRLQIRDQREGLHMQSGGILGPATKQLRYLTLQGSIRAESPAELEDMAAALLNAFDLEEAQRRDPLYEGVTALDFYTPTEDATHTPVVHELFLARPSTFPRLTERRSTGTTMAFAVELVCPDPRRYLFGIEDVVFDDTEGWSQALPNWAENQGVDVYPYLLVNFIESQSGASNFTITDSDGNAFTMDLSSQTADISIDMQTGEIYANFDGSSRAYLRSSEVDSWLVIPPDGTTWTITNYAGIYDVQVLYRQART